MLVNNLLKLIAICINSLSEFSKTEEDDRTFSETTNAESVHHFMPQSALDIKHQELIEYAEQIFGDLKYVN